MSENVATNDELTKTIELCKEHFDSMPILCGILNVSSSYIYKACNEGGVSLRTALKLEKLLPLIDCDKLNKEFGEKIPTWKSFSPNEAMLVDKVLDRI